MTITITSPDFETAVIEDVNDIPEHLDYAGGELFATAKVKVSHLERPFLLEADPDGWCVNGTLICRSLTEALRDVNFNELPDSVPLYEWHGSENILRMVPVEDLGHEVWIELGSEGIHGLFDVPYGAYNATCVLKDGSLIGTSIY